MLNRRQTLAMVTILAETYEIAGRLARILRLLFGVLPSGIDKTMLDTGIPVVVAQPLAYDGHSLYYTIWTPF